MPFDVVVIGHAERTVRSMLDELVGRESIRWVDDGLVLSIRDQSALVAVLARLNELGVKIDRVRRVPARDPASGG
jgi:hypothetical protein